MHQKSIREMNMLERQHYSLAAKVFRSTLLHCFILGLVALILGLAFYTIASARSYVTKTYSVAKSAYQSATHGADGAGHCRRIMAVYRSLTAEERADPSAPEYLARYSHLTESEDYITEVNILKGVLDANDDVTALYMAMYDRETGAVVYVADPRRDPAIRCPPGYWEAVDKRELEHFLNWDGEGMLYYFGRTAKHGWLCTAGVPIRSEAGEICGFVLADTALTELFRGMWAFVWRFSLTILILTALIGFLFARRFRKSFVEPINAIAEAAQGYMADRMNGSERVDHFASLGIQTGDEIENLSLIMADMERDLTVYEKNLTTVTAEKERIATELNLAASIQANILPSTFPAFPERKEFEIFASMTPAREVGGDFYDFFLVDEDHLAMVIADVSDKGIPAALFMMASRTMLKDAALSHLDPAAVLERVNTQLCENNPNYMFVTVWLGILEISSGHLTWADAGHEQLMLRQDGEWKLLPKKGGVALAVIGPELMEPDESLFHNHELTLRPGDVIFQYTDGVTEAMTADRAQFGTDRLLAELQEMRASRPEELLPFIRGRVDGFVQGAPQFDDITMLALEYRGKDA